MPAKNLLAEKRPFARFSPQRTSRDQPAQGDNSEFCGIADILIFAVTLKLLPQGNIRWRDLRPGTLLTTALFWLGNFVIKFYITVVFATSLHGAVASTIVFMLWVYY
jgi:membrane protein